MNCWLLAAGGLKPCLTEINFWWTVSGYQVEIPHNAIGIAVAEIDIAVGRLDVDDSVAPYKSAALADSPYSVSSQGTPCFDRIAQDLLTGNRAQTITKHAD